MIKSRFLWALILLVSVSAAEAQDGERKIKFTDFFSRDNQKIIEDEEIEFEVIKISDRVISVLCRNRSEGDCYYYGEGVGDLPAYEISVEGGIEYVELKYRCATGMSWHKLPRKSENVFHLMKPRNNNFIRVLLHRFQGNDLNSEGNEMVKIDIHLPEKEDE